MESPRLESLTDPPCGVRRELETLPPVELLNRRDQAEVPFLDQVKHVNGGAGVAAGVGDDQTKVRLDELVTGRQSGPDSPFWPGALGRFYIFESIQLAARASTRLHGLSKPNLVLGT